MLPEYMVPAAVVVLEELPLSASGKVDRRRLPAPEGRPQVGGYVEARTQVEQALAQIWREVLRLDRVGVEDNFFDLGGDSIQSIRIVARAHQEGIGLTVRQMFEQQTIGELRGGARDISCRGRAGTAERACRLTPIQHWYLDEEPPQAHHFNQSCC